jgi:hypothetical protein
MNRFLKALPFAVIIFVSTVGFTAATNTPAFICSVIESKTMVDQKVIRVSSSCVLDSRSGAYAKQGTVNNTIRVDFYDSCSSRWGGYEHRTEQNVPWTFHFSTKEKCESFK